MRPQDYSIPCYTIDLSARPRERYAALATAYKDRIQNLTQLFDSLLADLGIPKSLHRSINGLAKLMLRRVHSSTETEEIRGIAEISKVPMYLLVAFNVVLDLLMGCTSGAVRSLEFGQPQSESKMLHFRTLDWGMDPLRSVIVQLDFIKSKMSTGHNVLASTVTYVGFVGVLTGVRRGLSMSLNFRAVHNINRRRDSFKFYTNHLLVLLGLRKSISSLLRSYLLDEDTEEASNGPKTLASVAEELPSTPSTAAYLIFSDGSSTITLEKDYRTAVTRQSDSFIVLTNHDLAFEEATSSTRSQSDPSLHPSPTVNLGALKGLIEESIDRRECIASKWRSKVRKEYRRQHRESEIALATAKSHGMSTRSVTKSARASRSIGQIDHEIANTVTVVRNEIISWVSAWPTTNECTHYAAILDPQEGLVLWARRYPEPLEEPHGQNKRQTLGVGIHT